MDEPRSAARELSVVEIQQRVRAELDRLSDVVEPLGRLFAEAGEQVALVGGPVRDIMLGRLQTDLDLTTSAHPDVTERLLARLGLVRREELDDLGLWLAQLEHRLRLLEREREA